MRGTDGTLLSRIFAFRRLIRLPMGGEPMNSMAARRRRAMRAEKAREKQGARRAVRPVLEALSLPEDASGRAVRLTALGSSRLLVENHLGLAEVTEERVRLATREGMLAVSGEGLRLTDVRRGALCIAGVIREIQLPAGREAGHD